MNIYGIYDLKNKEQCLRIGTLREIINFLNITPRELGRAVKNHDVIRKQYEICYLFQE